MAYKEMLSMQHSYCIEEFHIIKPDLKFICWAREFTSDSSSWDTLDWKSCRCLMYMDQDCLWMLEHILVELRRLWLMTSQLHSIVEMWHLCLCSLLLWKSLLSTYKDTDSSIKSRYISLFLSKSASFSKSCVDINYYGTIHIAKFLWWSYIVCA